MKLIIITLCIGCLLQQCMGYYTSPGTRDWRTNTSEARTKATACPPQGNCGACPTGYNTIRQQTGACTFRCLCERDPYYYHQQATTQPRPSLSRSLLLGLLKNIQNNADALESMASGLSDEADLAQDVATIMY